MRKYRATYTISPEKRLEDIPHKTVYCGTSLVNSGYYGMRLKTLTDFLAIHFENIILFTPGYLYRHYYETFVDKQQHCIEPLEIAKHCEELYINQEIIPLLEHADYDITYKKWGDFVHTDDYLRAKSRVDNYMQSDSEFAQDIKNYALNFVNKQREFSASLTKEEAKSVQSCIDFQLEEITFFNMLAYQGLLVQAYPGTTLRAMKNISTQSYARTLSYSKDITFIDIALKRVGSRSRIKSAGDNLLEHIKKATFLYAQSSHLDSLIP